MNSFGARGITPPSRLALGTASLSFDAERGAGFDRVVHAALDTGIGVFDTATAYTTAEEMNHGEQLLGAALRRHPAGEDAVVISKGGHWRQGDEFPISGRPATLRRHVEASLRALRRDTIDLYLLHWPDPSVPIEESVGELDVLRLAGKLQAVGVSNVSDAQLRRAHGAAELDAVQNHLSVFEPEDSEVVSLAGRLGMTYLAHSPLSGRRGQARRFRVFDEMAAARGVTSQCLALAWVMAAGAHVIPVVGATRVETVADSAAAMEIAITESERSELLRLAARS